MAAKKSSVKGASKTYVSALRTLPDKFVACRDMRHAWAVLNNFHKTPDSQEGKKVMRVHRDLICMRCETVRHEEYLPLKGGLLDKVAQSYYHADGYLIPGVPRGANPQSVVQHEMYRRAMAEVAHAAADERETADH